MDTPTNVPRARVPVVSGVEGCISSSLFLPLRNRIILVNMCVVFTGKEETVKERRETETVEKEAGDAIVVS